MQSERRTPPRRLPLICEHQTLSVLTQGNDHIVDITRELDEVVASTGLGTGQVVCMVQGSTAALTTLEFEPGLVNHDIRAAMERLAPKDGPYLHEETWHDDNGHSHVRASTIGPSLALPVVSGSIPLGTWQQVVLIDFDTRPRKRLVHVSLVGT